MHGCRLFIITIATIALVAALGVCSDAEWMPSATESAEEHRSDPAEAQPWALRAEPVFRQWRRMSLHPSGPGGAARTWLAREGGARLQPPTSRSSSGTLLSLHCSLLS